MMEICGMELYKDKDGDIISKIANGVELNLLTTEVYSYIEWKENKTTTLT